jgi:hypothetical protein
MVMEQAGDQRLPPASPACQTGQRQGDERARQGQGHGRRAGKFFVAGKFHGKKRTDRQRGSIAHTAEQLGHGQG